jgi:multisubunit Na+/H+ antiporter MnhC subunit
MVRAIISIVLMLTFAAVMLVAAGCATGERQHGYYSEEQHQQQPYVPPRPYTAA